jgi:Tol biopolymer transport system component/tRNA A-37 threonylcarbamoyl transferase component Bud32
MGEVYRAFDAELRRTVALKFLHAHVAADERRMGRFVQEAQAASALNHPGILTVHDIGQTDEGVRFFTTEYVDGTTLREHMRRKSLRLTEVLDITIQIASALTAAHAAGIVHRDIKPENVMVRTDGYVKLLDFGLAKLAGNPSSDVDTEAATRAMVNTDPGSVMGTVNYMSPEQARGSEIDHRTDVWSLGCVLYECVVGRAPFEGRSPSHTIVAILDQEPPPLSRFCADVPEALQEIVSDALAKDPDARFQNAKQMLARLQRLKHKLDTGASLELSVPPNSTVSSGDHARWTGALSGPLRTATGFAETTAPTGDLAHAPSATSQASADGARRRPGLLRGPAIALITLAAAAAGFGVYHLAQKGDAPSAPAFTPQSMKLQKVPASGATVSAAVSPDGKYAARVVWEAGRSSLRLRQLATTSERDLVPADNKINYLGSPVFSHDGNHVYYVSARKGQSFFELYRVSINGGDAQKLVFDIDSAPTVSPDGRRIAFRRHVPRTREETLVVANEDGTAEQTIAAYKSPARIDNPAWSPDGRLIAFTVSGTDADGYYVNLDAVSTSDWTARKISSDRWRALGTPAWLSDSSGVVVNARDRASLPSTPLQLWFVPAGGGAAQRITNDLVNYVGVSLTSDSRTILAKQGLDVSNVWLAPAGDAARSRQATNAGINGGGSLSWLPDGRLVYDSDASGNADIWVMNADGTGQKQLTFDQLTDGHPAASPDGRYVVFRSNRGVGWGIWRMNADGSNARELVSNVEGGQGHVGQFTPDSRWLYYTARDREGRPVLFRVPVEGGEPQPVLTDKVGYVRLSPDGRWLFSTHQELEPNAPHKIYIYPVEGGEPARVLDAPEEMLETREWSPDSQSIDYVVTRDGVANLWRLPLSGGKPRQLTDWKSDYIYRFAWSPDGRTLAASRGTAMTDLVLIKDFR